MEGVTILETISNRVSMIGLGSSIVATIGILAMGVILLICVLLSEPNPDTFNKKIIGTFFGIVFLVLGVLNAVDIVQATNETWTTYRVEIDDSVKFNEFMEHYEFVEKTENGYIVKELN